METLENLRSKIHALDVERAKHRKLLNKYVGSGNLVYLNYHHADVVRLINEKNEIQNQIDSYYNNHPLVGLLSKSLRDSIHDAFDNLIMNGNAIVTKTDLDKD